MSALPEPAADPFEVRVEPGLNGACIVVVCGELDMETAPMLDRAMRNLPAGTSHVQMDLSELLFVDSAGLKQLIVADQLFAGRLTLLHPHRRLVQLLQLTGLDQHFTIDR